MRRFLTILSFCAALSVQHAIGGILIEAESFEDKGGWVVDQQFMDIMGSPYLMAHGMGSPVNDASTEVAIPEAGVYQVYVRTFNWVSPWYAGEGPGEFRLSIGNKRLSARLGICGDAWEWQPAGSIRLAAGRTTVRLHDMTGFNGRCDAIYLTRNENDLPPSDAAALAAFRQRMLGQSSQPKLAGKYDLIVVGGGIAGICTAVSAARLGCKVALIHDRPILGGNNSSEVRVHLGGRINIGPYPNLGNLLNEFGHTRFGNAKPAGNYEDAKKHAIVEAEKNIDLFLNYRANGVVMNGRSIGSIRACHIETGDRIELQGKLVCDCTGDAVIGCLAGADYLYGREGRDEFSESIAPVKRDSMVMGASVQWYSVEEKQPQKFPRFCYGLEFDEKNCQRVTMGEWTWETGMKHDQIADAEYIRDYGLLVVYSNWSYLKNRLPENDNYRNRRLGWVAYIAGKRESRRLLGDYILKQDDIVKRVFHEDGTAATTWTIDLHFPDPENEALFPEEPFKSTTEHIKIHPYPIPYRCLYSRNVENLFMAGRHISTTHVALGTTRVMRTTGMMGEVVGMAAWLCTKYGASPREVYFYHLPELKELMAQGTGRKDLTPSQTFNKGEMLKD